jgi:prepilin-type N-terminal cleavage/methylation domain-containing protein
MKAGNPHRNGISHDGFTLLELMVSSAVIGMLMMVLLGVTSTSLNLWRGSEEAISVDREGRTAMALISQDLASILVPVEKASRPEVDESTNAAVPLRFLTTKPADYQEPDKGDNGDVCFVEYRFRDNALLRGFAGSSNTFDKLPDFPVIPDEDFEVLATNVLQFKVWQWDREGNPVTDEAVAATLDVRLEVVDAKDLDNFRRNPQLLEAQGYKSRKYFFTRHAVPRAQ